MRSRLRAWLENRLPRSDSWVLTQRNLYILPTAAGWGFCGTLLVMLLASINYQLNLGYGLTFLLGGAALVSMHQTHGNLRRLVLHIKAPAPAFAGESATLEVVLDNAHGERFGIGLGWHDGPRQEIAYCDVPAQGQAMVHLRWAPPRRGLLNLPTVVVASHFPLGLFRTWTVWRPAATMLVYPAPEPDAPPLPASTGGHDGQWPARRGASGEFDGVRAYRRGDALRQLVWKKVARTGELVSREDAGSASRAIRIDAADAGLADVEARLSRLTAWVLQAQRQGQVFAFVLPGLNLPAAPADEQAPQALQALALWPQVVRA